MLSSSLQSTLDNRLRYLPPIVGEAIHSVDWSSALITIGKKFGLHIDDMEELQTVVLKSLVGLITPTDLERELISATAFSPANTQKLIQELNERVFEPIHDFVMNQGKKADPLHQAGIVVDAPTMETPFPAAPLFETEFTESISQPILLDQEQDSLMHHEESVHELDLPELSHGAPSEKPLLANSFEDFFISAGK